MSKILLIEDEAAIRRVLVKILNEENKDYNVTEAEDGLVGMELIKKEDYDQAIQAPVTASYHGPEIKVYAPYVSEMVRTDLIAKFGEEAYTNGFNVYTTIRAKHQQAANKAIQTALLDYDRRHGYRGPVTNIALPEDLSDRAALDKILKDYDNIGPLKTALVIETTDEKAELYIRNWGYAHLPLNAVKWAQKKLSTNSRGAVPKKITDAILNPPQLLINHGEAAPVVGVEFALAPAPETVGRHGQFVH